MTSVPQSLASLGAFWTSQGGVNLGVIGNQKHCGGYHLGKDRIFSDCACKPKGACVKGKRWADQSVQTSRDRAGLSNAASAIDLGRLNGSLAELHKFSDWLARRCVKNIAGTEDVKEVIYSPDGRTVLGFKDGIDFLIKDFGDRSHITHTHISYYRDSEKRDKTALFRLYFIELPDSGTEDPVPGPNLTDVFLEPGWVTVKDIPGVQAVQSDDLTIRDILAPGAKKPTIGKARVIGDPFGPDTATESRHIVRLLAGTDTNGAQVELSVILAGQVDFAPDPVADCTDAVNAEHERTKAAAIVAVQGI